MRTFRRALSTLVVGALLAALAPAHTATATVAGDFVVVLRDGALVSADAAAETARRLGSDIRFVYRHALQGYAGTLTPAALAAVRGDPNVSLVERNGVVRLDTTQVNPTWGLDRIDQRDLPLSSSYTYTSTGAGVRAYVIDTGIRYTHVDFGGRAVPGVDTSVTPNGGVDCYGHGTHVAGTIGGTTYGVAKSVQLVSVRVFDCNGLATHANVIAGVDWVTADRLSSGTGTPAVANMSLGSLLFPPVDLAVQRSISLGRVAYAVSAGNSAADACTRSPAATPEAMTIGASASNDSAAWFSNFGPCVDWYAPGVDVVSAYIFSDTSTASLSGTSMASPHTAGVAAQYLQLNPSATPATVAAALAARLTQNKITGVGYDNNDLLFTDL